MTRDQQYEVAMIIFFLLLQFCRQTAPEHYIVYGLPKFADDPLRPELGSSWMGKLALFENFNQVADEDDRLQLTKDSNFLRFMYDSMLKISSVRSNRKSHDCKSVALGPG